MNSKIASYLQLVTSRSVPFLLFDNRDDGCLPPCGGRSSSLWRAGDLSVRNASRGGSQFPCCRPPPWTAVWRCPPGSCGIWPTNWTTATNNFIISRSYIAIIMLTSKAGVITASKRVCETPIQGGPQLKRRRWIRGSAMILRVGYNYGEQSEQKNFEVVPPHMTFWGYNSCKNKYNTWLSLWNHFPSSFFWLFCSF